MEQLGQRKASQGVEKRAYIWEFLLIVHKCRVVIAEFFEHIWRHSNGNRLSRNFRFPVIEALFCESRKELREGACSRHNLSEKLLLCSIGSSQLTFAALLHVVPGTEIDKVPWWIWELSEIPPCS